MNIKFIDTKLSQLAIDLAGENQGEQFDFSFSPAFSEASKNEFLIVFNIKLSTLEFNLNIEYLARFETDEEIDDSFKDTNFVNINAPAIAYPFLRAFISNITVNAGFKPVILPTLNFTKFQKNHSE
jgi:preprotein translocase subunit SecB